METRTVKAFMVPLEEYATVTEEATLFDAVLALEKAQEAFNRTPYAHRAILVCGPGGRIIGKIGQFEVLAALEPRYKDLVDFKHTSRFGFSPEFLTSMMETHGLWRRPLDDICRRCVRIKVKDIMALPTAAEYIPEEATLNEAIHRLVMGRHLSLLVTRQDLTVGILRLCDVFHEVCNVLKTCEV